MKYIVVFALVFLINLPLASSAQNCCVPAVPQQGVIGETVATPHTLEVGLHYEYIRSEDAKVIWKRATMTTSYGIIPRLSVSIVAPYVWKKKYSDETKGIGDITGLIRFGLIPRDFVHFRELSIGFGVKFPTGAVDRRKFGFLLAEELQPGTGSWDYQASFSFYKGLEPVDFTLSGTYVLTTAYEDYEFGNQFSYLLSSNIHLMEKLDLSASLSGAIRAKDQEMKLTGDWGETKNTGRHQLWFTPGILYQAIEGVLRLQAYCEIPIYQYFNGTQLGSDYNIRFSLTSMIPLKKSDEGDL